MGGAGLKTFFTFGRNVAFVSDARALTKSQNSKIIC